VNYGSPVKNTGHFSTYDVFFVNHILNFPEKSYIKVFLKTQRPDFHWSAGNITFNTELACRSAKKTYVTLHGKNKNTINKTQ
jgi:hypothetical protein